MIPHSETRKEYEACYRLVRIISPKIRKAGMLPDAVYTPMFGRALHTAAHKLLSDPAPGRYQHAALLKKLHIEGYELCLNRFGKRK